MIPGLTILSPALSASTILNPARAPARWQQVTTEAAWRVNELRRATAWVSILKGFQTGLLQGPVWGAGLEAATRQSSRQPADAAAQVPRSARKRVKHEGAMVAPRAEVRSAPRATNTERRPSAECSRLPSHANGELLRSCAEYRRPSLASLKQLVAHGGAGNLTLSPHLDVARSSSATRPVSEASSSLADLLSQRVARTMSRFDRFSTQPIHVAGARNDRAWTDQWSGLLDGPAASPELLNFSVDSRSEIAVTNGNYTGEGSLQAAARVPRHAPIATSNATQSEMGPVQGRNEDRSTFGHAPEVLNFTPSFQVAPLTAVPNALERHLPLLTRGGGVEDHRDWDLEALSAGIKRILDEEARRHGIDV